LDGLTLLIELIGIGILLLWIVLPVREFRGIFARIRHRDNGSTSGAGEERRSP
jgi:hypothetical protein